MPPRNTTTQRYLTAFALASLALGIGLAGCAAPNPQIAAFSPEQAESNRQLSEKIEAVARVQQHEERMSRAQATEMSTRNAPSSVSTTQVYAPRF